MKQWQQWRDKTEALSLRERGILTAVVVVLILFVWLQFVYTPIDDEKKKLNLQMTQTNQKMAELAAQMAVLEQKLSNDPNKALRQQQQSLKQRLGELGKEVESRFSNLVSPEHMVGLLKDILKDYKGLKLRHVANLDVVPLKIDQGKKQGENQGQKRRSRTPGKEPQNQAVIYSHGLELVLEGQYFQLFEFLQRLETLKGFFWSSLDYQVKSYPKAEITIRINTLSLEEDWIGV